MKCSNCGAEIPSTSKVCEFCGTQVTVEMRKEQEQLNKVGCPKCGSSNITFEREKQGEVKGKKGTAVVRNTVGFCKDCGHTWTTTQIPKKRKTWLWVLGWIFIFPVPLTILLLRPTCRLDKKIKYGIIAAAWLIYLIFIFANRSKDDKKTTSESQISVEQQVETKTEDITKDIEVSQPKQEESAPADTVEIKIEPRVNDEDGTVLFGITSNEPEDTRYTITLSNSNGLNETDTATILANGQGFTAEFSDNGVGLDGEYTVTVSDLDGNVLKTEDFTFTFEKADDNTSDVTGVDPDLKAFLDSYEAYMDEYCDFMENYDANDLTMLTKYADMMTKYADFAEKADAYDSDTMSPADSAYYLEVMTRVNAKLAKVAYTN